MSDKYISATQFSKIQRGRYLMAQIRVGFNEEDFLDFCDLVRERFHSKEVKMKTVYCFPFGCKAPSKKKQLEGLRKSFSFTFKQARYFLKYASVN